MFGPDDAFNEPNPELPQDGLEDDCDVVVVENQLWCKSHNCALVSDSYGWWCPEADNGMDQ